MRGFRAEPSRGAQPLSSAALPALRVEPAEGTCSAHAPGQGLGYGVGTQVTLRQSTEWT